MVTPPHYDNNGNSTNSTMEPLQYDENEPTEAAIDPFQYNEEDTNDAPMDPLQYDEEDSRDAAMDPLEYKKDDSTEAEIDPLDYEEKYFVSSDDSLSSAHVPATTADVDERIVSVELPHRLENLEVKELLQKCLIVTASQCLFCNYAQWIAVDGKQLGIHALISHKFSAIVKNNDIYENISSQKIAVKIEEGLIELESTYFTLVSNAKDEDEEKPCRFMCCMCSFVATAHKALYKHTKAKHAMLICVICKAVYFSYTELLHHLCPGTRLYNLNVQFRCSICNGTEHFAKYKHLKHLRKIHNTCDICFKVYKDQLQLLEHMNWHPTDYFCYTCDIAFRYKTHFKRHLYEDHGLRSIICKKCHKKKYPFVYHFCGVSLNFPCDRCKLRFATAERLNIHKKFHKYERKHICKAKGCGKRFNSAKALWNHRVEHMKSETYNDEMAIITDDENIEENYLRKAKRRKHVNLTRLNVSDNSDDETVVLEPKCSSSNVSKKVKISDNEKVVESSENRKRDISKQTFVDNISLKLINCHTINDSVKKALSKTDNVCTAIAPKSNSKYKVVRTRELETNEVDNTELEPGEEYYLYYYDTDSYDGPFVCPKTNKPLTRASTSGPKINKEKSRKELLRSPEKSYGFSSDEDEEPRTKWSRYIKSAPVSPSKTSVVYYKRRGQQEYQEEICYCRRPYKTEDDFIRCKGTNCKIKFFHCDCIGVQKTKLWYCPDCPVLDHVKSKKK